MLRDRIKDLIKTMIGYLMPFASPIIKILMVRPRLVYYKGTSSIRTNFKVAQRKRDGPITHGHEDRNIALIK